MQLKFLPHLSTTVQISSKRISAVSIRASSTVYHINIKVKYHYATNQTLTDVSSLNTTHNLFHPNSIFFCVVLAYLIIIHFCCFWPSSVCEASMEEQAVTSSVKLRDQELPLKMTIFM